MVRFDGERSADGIDVGGGGTGGGGAGAFLDTDGGKISGSRLSSGSVFNNS